MSSKSPGVPSTGSKRQGSASTAPTSLYQGANPSSLSFDSALIVGWPPAQASTSSQSINEVQPKPKKTKKPKKTGIDAQVKAAVANVGLTKPSDGTKALPPPAAIPKSKVPIRPSAVTPLLSRPNGSSVSLPLTSTAAPLPSSLKPQTNVRSRSSNNLRQATVVPLGELPLLIAQPLASTSAVSIQDSVPQLVEINKKKKKRKPKPVEPPGTTNIGPAISIHTPSIERSPASAPIEEAVPAGAEIAIIGSIENAEEEAQNVARQEYQAAMRRRDVWEGQLPVSSFEICAEIQPRHRYGNG